MFKLANNDLIHYGPISNALYKGDYVKAKKIIDNYISKLNKQHRLIESDTMLGYSSVHEGDGKLRVYVGTPDLIKKEIFNNKKVPKKLLDKYKRAIIVHELLETEAYTKNKDFLKYIDFGHNTAPYISTLFGAAKGELLARFLSPKISNKTLSKIVRYGLPISGSFLGYKAAPIVESLYPYVSRSIKTPLTGWGGHRSSDIISLEGVYMKNVLKDKKLFDIAKKIRKDSGQLRYFNRKGYHYGDIIPKDVTYNALFDGNPSIEFYRYVGEKLKDKLPFI